MSVSYPRGAPPEEIGVDLLGRLSGEQDYIHVVGLPVVEMDPLQRSAYVKRLVGELGEITLTGGKQGTEVWELNRMTSPNAAFIPFHTDNPFLKAPELLVSFWSLRSSLDGGENLILPVRRLIDWLHAGEHDSEFIEEIMQREINFDHNGQHARGTVLNPQQPSARFDKKYVASEDLGFADRFSKILAQARPVADSVKLAEGDMLIFNNITTLHARAPYSDPARLSLRVRVKDI